MISLVWLAGASLLAQAQDYFTLGTAAFKQGEYRRALALFEQERERGSDPKLTYNIGVTHFKLGNFREAGSAFRTLLDSPEWRHLARFQLGLVAEKRGHRSRAISHYTRVRAQAESARLRTLSGRRLAALAPERSRAGAPGRWLAVASVSAGHDDNVFALQDELVADSTLAGDNYSELFAWGQYRLAGTAADGWRLQGSGYRRGYSEYSALDVSSYDLGVSRDLYRRGWQLELGAAADSTTLGGEQLARATRLIGRAQRTFSGIRVSLAYLPIHYSGGSRYAQLDGWRHRFEAKLRRPLGPLIANALYRLDINDRADLAGDDGDFYSYSPTRHSAGLELEWPLRENWEVSTGVEYRTSEYGGVNRLTDTDGVVKQGSREADKVSFWLKSQLYLLPRLQLAGKLAMADNEENFNIYTHDKTEASLGLRYSF